MLFLGSVTIHVESVHLYTSHKLIFVPKKTLFNDITIKLTQFYQNFGNISNDSDICAVK